MSSCITGWGHNKFGINKEQTSEQRQASIVKNRSNRSSSKTSSFTGRDEKRLNEINESIRESSSNRTLNGNAKHRKRNSYLEIRKNTANSDVLANIGFDIAESEPSEACYKGQNFARKTITFTPCLQPEFTFFGLSGSRLYEKVWHCM